MAACDTYAGWSDDDFWGEPPDLAVFLVGFTQVEFLLHLLHKSVTGEAKPSASFDQVLHALVNAPRTPTAFIDLYRALEELNAHRNDLVHSIEVEPGRVMRLRDYLLSPGSNEHHSAPTWQDVANAADRATFLFDQVYAALEPLLGRAANPSTPPRTPSAP